MFPPSSCLSFRLALVVVFVSPMHAQVAGTAIVRHAPTVNGTIEGSVQVLAAETVTLNGGAVVTGDLLVPGTPVVRLNGGPAYGATRDGTGAPAPATHAVVLNGAVQLRSVVRRSDPAPLPVVAPPPAPAGTRIVTVAASSQLPISFAAVRDFTVTGRLGTIRIPPGSYGTFSAGGGAILALGVTGSAQPTAYAFERLTINGSSQVTLLGPVVITVASGVSVGGTLGNGANPSWLRLELAAGDLTVAGGGAVYGLVVAPGGTVAVATEGQVVGAIACDRLTLAGGGRLRLPTPLPGNRPPVVALTAPLNGATIPASGRLVLRAAATDPDGTIARVEFYRGTTKLGERIAAPYEWTPAGLGNGAHTLVARATDNRGAEVDSAPVTISITGAPGTPRIAIAAPVDGTLVYSPAAVVVEAAQGAASAVPPRVEFLRDGIKWGERSAPPYALTTAPLGPGTYRFSVRATDAAGGLAISTPVVVTVIASAPAPEVAILAPPEQSAFAAPASFAVTAEVTGEAATGAKVAFFQNGTRVGEAASPPFALAISGLGPGSYALVARASNSAGNATESAPRFVSVVGTNQPPVVDWQAPADGGRFGAPADLLLQANASDADGRVARVEFFHGALRLGEAVAAPFALAWRSVPAGTYVLAARATDNSGGAGHAPARTIFVLPTVPYHTGFETSEQFAPGSLAGQGGWQGATGIVIAETAAYRGALGLQVPPASPPGLAVQNFLPASAPVVTFVDVWARPAAGADAPSAVFLRDEVTRLALVRRGESGEVHVWDGDGAVGGVWRGTGGHVPLGADGRVAAWQRFTLREDFGAGRWDAYVGGRMVAADLRFADPARTALGQVALVGHGEAVTSFDDLYVGPENPLFADADRDGMEDAWEAAHGLNVAVNDRGADPDGDGRSNVAEYLAGTHPQRRDTDGDGLPDGWEQIFGTNPLVADAAADPDEDGLTNVMEYLLRSHPFQAAFSDEAGVLRLRVYRPGT